MTDVIIKEWRTLRGREKVQAVMTEEWLGIVRHFIKKRGKYELKRSWLAFGRENTAVFEAENYIRLRANSVYRDRVEFIEFAEKEKRCVRLRS